MASNIKGNVGWATYYCKAGSSPCHYQYPDRSGPDYYAAAGPALRVGRWRGRMVTVCAIRSLRCLQVKLIDFCGCHKGTSDERIIDLYWDAMHDLGGSGKIKVRVGW